MHSNEADLGRYFLVSLLASVKFLFSPFLAKGLNLSFFESFVSTSVGGVAGIFAFGLIGEIISDSWKKITIFFYSAFVGKIKAEAIVAARPKFKWITRFIVKIKHRLGLFGLAFLSPCLISIPIGAIACMAFFSHQRKRAFIYLFLSLAFWTIVLNSVAYFKTILHFFL